MSLNRRVGSQRSIYMPIFLFIFIICAGALFFQFARHRGVKTEIISYKLKILNTIFSELIKEGVEPHNLLSSKQIVLITNPNDELRLSYFDKSGTLVYDSHGVTVLNNFSGKEIVQALEEGEGNSICSLSSSDSRRYYLYAVNTGSGVVRSALPYKISFGEVLCLDREFLWFLCFLVISITLFGLVLSRWIFRRIVNVEESEKNKMRREMTNNINHELKTPVSSIKGYLDTLINHPEIDEATKKLFIESCAKQSDRLSRLLQDIATITRMYESPHQIEKEHIPVCDIIEDVIMSTRLLGQQNGIVVSTNFDSLGAVFVYGNEMLVESIFRNLIENSLSYSGGKRLDIDITEQNNNYVTFFISDDGVGVDPRHLPHIFERFYRIDKGRSRKAGGTGLGLSIVKNAVLLHGGTISVSNQSGGGLCFEFTLSRV